MRICACVDACDVAVQPGQAGRPPPRPAPPACLGQDAPPTKSKKFQDPARPPIRESPAPSLPPIAGELRTGPHPPFSPRPVSPFFFPFFRSLQLRGDVCSSPRPHPPPVADSYSQHVMSENVMLRGRLAEWRLRFAEPGRKEKKREQGNCLDSLSWIIAFSGQVEDMRRDHERPKRRKKGNFSCPGLGALSSATLVGDRLRFGSGKTSTEGRFFAGRRLCSRGEGGADWWCWCFLGRRARHGSDSGSAARISLSEQAGAVSSLSRSCSGSWMETSLEDGESGLPGIMKANGNSISSPTVSDSESATVKPL